MPEASRAEKHRGEQPKRLEKIVLTGSKILKGAGALALLSAVSLAVIGRRGDGLSHKAAGERVTEAYMQKFSKSSPAGKYSLQYLTPNLYTIGKFKGDFGLLSLLSMGRYEVTIGNACLKDTAYDVYSGGGATTPTATVSTTSPDTLTISDGPDLPPLNFSGLDSQTGTLVPADIHTSHILATYGCETGVTSVVSKRTGDVKSPLAQDVGYN